QLRLPRLLHPRRAEGGQGRLQLRDVRVVDDVGGARNQRLPQGGRADLSHVFDVRPGPGHAERRVPIHGPRSKGARRGRCWGAGLGSPPGRVLRLMSLSRALSVARLIRPTRRRGFCPACRGWETGAADRLGRGESEISPPALTALAFLALAAVAWALTIWQSWSPDGM